jgi:predicted HNH restriction endonuclease
LQTHHIKHQEDTDPSGFIDYTQKNTAYNLIILCYECHKNLHQLDKKIITKQVPNGIIMELKND